MAMANESQFTDYLNREFDRRRQSNASYSIRAFARDLEMSPQKLGQVLRGTSGLSVEAATDLAGRIELNQNERELFLAMVEAKHHRSSTVRKTAAEKLERMRAAQEFERIPAEQHKEFMQWYYNPILLLTDLEDFKPTAEYVSSRLGLTKKVAADAIEKMLEVGLLVRDEKKGWRRGKKNIFVKADQSFAELREYYSQYISKAAESVHREPFEKRDVSLGLVTVRESDIGWVKEEIKKFRQQLMKKLIDSSEPSERIYALAIQYFPVDHV